MWAPYSSTRSTTEPLPRPPDFSQRGGGGVLPYMGHIGMRGPERFGFFPVLVINRIGIDFGHFGLK